MKTQRTHLQSCSTPAALLFGLVVVLAATPGGRADSRGVPVFTDGVASGDVTATSAILWTRIDRDTNVKVEVWNNPALQGTEVSAGAGTFTLSSKDEGALEVDPTTSGSCTVSQWP